jgi:hypothetical protein
MLVVGAIKKIPIKDNSCPERAPHPQPGPGPGSFDDDHLNRDDLRPIVGILIGTLIGLCAWIALGFIVCSYLSLWRS